MLNIGVIKKAFLALLVIGVYFTIWRPIRGGIAHYLLSPITAHFDVANTDQDLYIKNNNSLSFEFHFKDGSQGYKELMFKISGGIFFLFGCVAIVLLSDKPVSILWQFFVLQIGLIIIGILLLILGLYLNRWGIYLVDLMARYGDALINLGFLMIKTQLGTKLKSATNKV